MSVEPFSLRDAPALIERVFPSQKVSAEAFKEQMAGPGKTLTALGSYWKGRKPLVLNKAVILASLLPATDDLERDLEVFDALMGMDDDAFLKRLPNRSPLREKIATTPYTELVRAAERAENVPSLCDDVWPSVNAHLGTSATSMPELVEQLGVMRFGHRPRFADVFSGSGQIPFEAARLGLETFASDLNPIACMLTWGAFNVVGASPEERERLEAASKELVAKVQAEVDTLGIESDGQGWTARTFLYCLEVRCPESGWMVPLLPSLVVSQGQRSLTPSVAHLVPDPVRKRYEIVIEENVDAEGLKEAEAGTLQKEGRGAETFVVHSPDGVTTFRVPFTRIREGQPTTPGAKPPGLRQWERSDIAPRPDDTLQERLYAIVWQRPLAGKRRTERCVRSVTPEDLEREVKVRSFVEERLTEWQERGFVPTMRIEPGDKTDEPIRTRGWTHWHHLFNPRQLLVLGLLFKHASASDQYARMAFGLGRALDYASRLGHWHAGRDNAERVFYNQALNTFFNYATRSSTSLIDQLEPTFSEAPAAAPATVVTAPANAIPYEADVFICDAPYGDAVKYEEILEFFIAWFQKNPPPEFANWTWDSRRSLAIKGEDHDFKRSMIDAYSTMARKMPDNGINVLMFTHQSGKIWADIASIIWGAGLQVTAAWYVTTETDSAIRQGANVKGTVMLVLRKRQGDLQAFQDNLAFELALEVNRQVKELVGLNEQVREHSARDENAFNDADLQMAGYAAALRVLTKYRRIDGKDMVSEAQRPRVQGETTVVDTLIDFAVNLANAALVPQGITEGTWGKLNGVERYYLKMLEQEAHGVSSLDSFQQFAKAFRVREPQAVMASSRANQARLKSSVELGRSEMHEASEFGGTPLRAVLFAMQQLAAGADRDKVLTGLRENVRDYYQVRSHVRAIAQYLHQTLGSMRPEEAEHARLVDLFIMNESA